MSPGDALGSLGERPGRERELTDDRLAALATDGDRRAVAAIYRRYHQPLYRYCAALLGNPEDAHDALQSTMLKVLRALPGEARRVRLRPWLYRIAHNESVELLRRRRPCEPLDPDQIAIAVELDAMAEARDRLRRLMADLAQLPERQRGALAMRELAGLSFEELAGALGMSAAAARQAVYEARLALQRMDAGRELPCDEVRRTLSDGDRHTLRRRELRAHLRKCPDCRSFRDGIAQRRRDFALLAPLPAAGAASLFHAIIGGAGTSSGAILGGGTATAAGGGGAGAGAAGISAAGAGAAGAGTGAGLAALGGGGGALGQALAGSALLKSVAIVAMVGAVGVTAVERGGLHLLPAGKVESANRVEAVPGDAGPHRSANSERPLSRQAGRQLLAADSRGPAAGQAPARGLRGARGAAPAKAVGGQAREREPASLSSVPTRPAHSHAGGRAHERPSPPSRGSRQHAHAPTPVKEPAGSASAKRHGAAGSASGERHGARAPASAKRHPKGGGRPPAPHSSRTSKPRPPHSSEPAGNGQPPAGAPPPVRAPSPHDDANGKATDRGPA